MPEITPERQYKQYLVCGDAMKLIRELTIACAQTEFDEGIHTCSNILEQIENLRSAFEPEEFPELETEADE